MTEISLPSAFIGRKVMAKYVDSLVPEYKGNPLIEALPRFYAPQEILGFLTYYPHITNEMIASPDPIRRQIIYNFNQFFKPNNHHVELYDSLFMAINSSYITRNPLDFEYFKQLKEVENSQFDLTKDNSRLYKLVSKLPGFTFFGMSGLGKTISVQKLIILLPQVIYHSSYKEKEFVFTQIVWMYIETPSDGGVKGFLLSFFQVIDQILDTNDYGYYTKNGRASVDEMVPHMVTLAGIYGIGAIILDEVHRLNNAKGDELRRMIETFALLANQMKVVIIPVGKTTAKKIFGENLQIVRRFTGVGDIEWTRMTEEIEWDRFIEALWRLQLLKRPSDLTPELKRLFFTLSQGIPDFAVKLFLLSQNLAITTSMETITEDVVFSIYENKLNNARPLLDAIRNNDKAILDEIDDIPPIDIRFEVAKNIKMLPVDPSENEEPVIKPEQNGQGAELQKIESHNSPQAQDPMNSNRSVKIKSYSEGDLRLIPTQAKNNHATIHDTLMQNGMIRTADEYWR